MQEKTKTIFFDRDFLFPKIDNNVEENEEEQDTFKLPPPFAVGIHITVTFFARCIKIALVDVAAEQHADMDAFRTEKKNNSVTFVNACKAPTMGAVVAAVPTMQSRNSTSTSTSTLLEPQAPSTLVGGVAMSDGSSTGSSLQELLAKTVGERLIMKINKMMKQKNDEADVEVQQQQKLLLVSCGLGIGAGVNPRDGSEFLSSALSNPMLAGGIVNACFEML